MFDAAASFFAICFLVGLVFSLVSVIGGVGHFGAHTGHFHAAHSHGGAAHHGGSSDLGDGVSFFNFSSLTIFITWFGAIGFVLRWYKTTGMLFILLFSSLGGLLGAYIVYLFLAKFLLKGQSKPLSINDTYMPGTIAKVISGIKAGGTGEIVYVHLGTRRSCGARSINGTALVKGTKVMILKYDKGIAYVKPYSELSDEI